MVGSLKQSLLVLSSIVATLGGCTYNEDELRPGNPGPRDASVEDVPSSPDLGEPVDLPGPADLPRVEGPPTVSVALDADMPIDDAGTADVPEISDVADGADDARPDVIRTDASTDAPAPERDAPASPNADSGTDRPFGTDASVDTADGPATGRDAADAGVGDSARDSQQGESRGLDSEGLAG